MSALAHRQRSGLPQQLAAQRRAWLSSRHSLPVELAMVLGLYTVYEATRGRHPYLVAHGYWRSFLNQRKRRYFSSPQDVRPFLITPYAEGQPL